MTKPFRKVKSSDPVVSRMQDNVADALAPVIASSIVGGRLVGPIGVSPAGSLVNHGLGRNPAGWFLVSPQASGSVWQGPSSSPNLFLVVSASSPLTGSFWCF